MSLKTYAVICLKILAAKWLRIRSRLSEHELDVIMDACAGEPDLRHVLVDVLALRR